MGPRRPLELSGGRPGVVWQRRSSRGNERVHFIDVQGPNEAPKLSNIMQKIFSTERPGAFFKVSHQVLDTGQIPIKKLPKLAQRLDFLTLHAR